jgi:carbon-monoxide dehydrogenase medium subunit
VIGTFEYVRPRTVNEAVAALQDGGGNAVAYAGGTDLLVEIRNRVRTPALLVDLKGIEELDDLTVDDDGIHIGAVTSLNRVAESLPVRRRVPALSEAALSIGTYQLRSRATVAGNLCNASPAADTAPVLLALEAELAVTGPHGQRVLPLREFFTGVKRTSLEVDEIVVGIRIPAPEGRLRTAFRKQQRIRGHDLAVVNVAASYDPERERLLVAIGSCAPTPLLLEPVDTQGAALNAVVEAVVTSAEASAAPISDVRASAEYRRAVLPVLLRRLGQDVLPCGGDN